MATIEEKAKEYADNYVVGDSAIIVDLLHKVAEESYIAGATEQRKIDIDKAWQFIEVTIIREGLASEDFVKEMNWRFKRAMEE